MPEPTSRVALAKNIRRERTLRGWSGRELAERVGVAQPRIAELENPDGPDPSTKLIDRVADALGVHPSQLLIYSDLATA